MAIRFITSGKEERDIRKRLRLLIYVVSALFVFMLGRLWILQVFEGSRYRIQSEGNRLRLREVHALRGPILDRAGRTLAHNRASFDLFAVAEDLRQTDRSLSILAPILGVDHEELAARVREAPRSPYREALIAKDLGWEQVVKIEARADQLEGFHIRHVFVRLYPYGSLAAHVLGHLGEITEQEGAREEFSLRYRPGDLVGKTGVERSQETFLKGVDGGELVEVDAYGHKKTVVEKIQSVAGARVYLTLDLDLQSTAEEAMAGRSGAVVALDPRNGEVLALVSHPNFDPNSFGRGVDSSVWKSLVSDPEKPLQNRAISGVYSPGSTFKLITSIAALRSGRMDRSTPVHCRGEYHFGDRAYRCWREHGHGKITFHRGLVESCDIYYYIAGLSAGIDAIADTAFEFGLGRKTGIQLIGEQAGLVPTREWKKKTYREPWMEGETLSVAIGQSFMSVTPIQLVTAFASFANGGQLYRPRVVSRAIDAQDRLVSENPVDKVRDIAMKRDVYHEVLEALEGVVNEPHGTGWRARIRGVTVAGKTGTAQVVRMKERTEEKDMEEIPYEFRDHAWFVSFLPADQPQLAVVALVEHAGHGGTAAAPVARAVMERFIATRNLPSL